MRIAAELAAANSRAPVLTPSAGIRRRGARLIVVDSIHFLRLDSSNTRKAESWNWKAERSGFRMDLALSKLMPMHNPPLAWQRHKPTPL